MRVSNIDVESEKERTSFGFAFYYRTLEIN